MCASGGSAGFAAEGGGFVRRVDGPQAPASGFRSRLLKTLRLTMIAAGICDRSAEGETLSGQPASCPRYSVCRKNLRRSGGRPHPCSVRHSGPVSLPRPARRRVPFILQHVHSLGVKFVCFFAILSLIATAQSPIATNPAARAAKSATGSSALHSSSNLDVLADPPGLLY